MQHKDIKNLNMDSLMAFWQEARDATLEDVEYNVKKGDHIRALQVLGESGAGVSLAYAMYWWRTAGDIVRVKEEIAKGKTFLPKVKELIDGALNQLKQEKNAEGALSKLRSAPFYLIVLAVLGEDSRECVEHLSCLLPFLVKEDTGYESLNAAVLLSMLVDDGGLKNKCHNAVEKYIEDKKIKSFFKGNYILYSAIEAGNLEEIHAALNRVDSDFKSRAGDHKVLGQLQGLSWANQIEIDLLATGLLKLAQCRGMIAHHNSAAIPEPWMNI